MAIVLVEGWDTYNGNGGSTATTVGAGVRWGMAAVYATMSATTPYNTGQSLYLVYTTGSKYAYTSVPPNSSGSVGFALYTSEFPTGSIELVQFLTGTFSTNSRQFALHYLPGGALGIGTGIGTPTIVYTTPSSLVPATWNYIELEFTIGNSAAINIYVNGSLFGSATGLDTQTQAGSTYDLFMFGTFGSTGYGFVANFDDVYLTDTPTRLGERRVVTVVPASDSTPSQWAASGGAVAPYTMVDEALCNADVDYIFDTTIGDRSVFNMASTGATPLSVSAVQLGSYTRKTDTGPRAMQLEYVTAGGTAYTSSDFVLSASYARQLRLLETNPATSTAWTPTEANNLKVGVKVSA